MTFARTKSGRRSAPNGAAISERIRLLQFVDMRSSRACIALLVCTAYALLALCVAPASAGPEIPGKPQDGPIALVGGTVHTVSGATIAKAVVLFDKGKITAVGADVPLPEGVKKIDAAGKHVYPGLIAANATVGLIEIDAIRATVDHTEVGLINPNVRAQAAVNPDSEVIPVTRANGVLLMQASPRGPLLQGQSALMALDGWTWEEMTLAAPLAVHLNWPATQPVSANAASSAQQNEDRSRQLTILRKAMDDARAYRTAKQANSGVAVDLRWEAMIPVLERRLPLHVQADRAPEIQAAIGFAAKENVKIVIVGGYDAVQSAELLKKQDIPVIINTVNRLPLRQSDAYDAAFTLPERLRKTGVKYCICDGGRFEASGLRNLPYEAAAAAAYGLPADEALKAITLYPAQILGVAERVGSLEAGKDATLFVADGDILEIASNVEMAFIGGRAVDLNNRHKRLFEKYQEKQRRAAKP
jgi:imidazolonepropionase-like amidohydrolase